jgi:phosphate transport system substrate-binding protein
MLAKVTIRSPAGLLTFSSSAVRRYRGGVVALGFARGDRRRALGLIAALLLVACRPVPPDTPTVGTAVNPAWASLHGSLVGAGSSFQAPFQEVAIDAFSSVARDLAINYQGSGSGRGKQELADQLVDFAGTDSRVKPEDRSKFKGGALLSVPVAGAPVAITYNLSGVEFLQLSPANLAGIFQRDITRWDDPRVAADNPGSSLPAQEIILARRADSSGTTSNFTSYLAVAAAGPWRLGAGDSVAWPDDTQAGVGNAGVSQIVKSTPGSIGYVDFADAKALGLLTVAVRNRAGAYVRPTLEAASAALAVARVSDDLEVDALDAAGDAAYPITAVTYILTYRVQHDAETADALRGYLTFLVSDGQALATRADMAALPEPLRRRAEAALAAIEVG